MPTYAFMNIFQGESGMPEDRYVNTWHFFGSTGTVTDFDNVRDMLKDFYNKEWSGGERLTLNMANLIQEDVRVVAYELDQPKPRAPVYESEWTADPFGSGSPCPFEVSLCMSYEGEKVSGQKQARRRNRVYLGPFRGAVLGLDGRPTAALLTNVKNAGAGLKAASDASVNWEWVVYSQTDRQIMAPKHLWVDDSWDTQRRRGLSPTRREEVFF